MKEVVDHAKEAGEKGKADLFEDGNGEEERRKGERGEGEKGRGVGCSSGVEHFPNTREVVPFPSR